MDLPQEIIREAVEIFRSMLGVQLSERPASEARSPGGDFEVSAIVAITGACPGRLILSFPEEAACGFVSRMSGRTYKEVDAEVMDGVEELANIVAGNGCRHLEARGFAQVATAVPHIMIGQQRWTPKREDTPWAAARWFDSELGSVRLEVELNAAAAA